MIVQNVHIKLQLNVQNNRDKFCSLLKSFHRINVQFDKYF